MYVCLWLKRDRSSVYNQKSKSQGGSFRDSGKGIIHGLIEYIVGLGYVSNKGRVRTST